MEPENVTEFKMLRQELLSIKNCITSYMGFVLAGSGIAAFALAFTGAPELAPTVATPASPDLAALAYSALSLSLVVSLVLVILFYKFASHNRAAGYCRLLTIERFKRDAGAAGQRAARREECYMGWEWCVSQLREQDRDGPPVADAHIKWYKGAQVLVWHVLLGRKQGSSWSFPPYVTAVFALLCFGLLSTGMTAGTVYVASGPDVTAARGMVGFIVLVSLAQVTMWHRFFHKLALLMEGTGTVHGYVMRFAKVREKFLEPFGVTPVLRL